MLVYIINILFCLHRVISNYEYAESDYSILQSDSILESARKAELELNSNVLRKLIQSIWGGKVTYDHRGISVYKHLQKRSVTKGFNKKIKNLDIRNSISLREAPWLVIERIRCKETLRYPDQICRFCMRR